MKFPSLTGIVFSIAIQGSVIAAANYPADKLEFQNNGKFVVAITEPCESAGTEKWNTITIRFPEPIKYSPTIKITGTVALKSAVMPSHIGFNLLNLKDRFGFAKVVASQNGETSFSLTLGDFVRSTELGGGELKEGEEIWAIRVYASFAEPVDSTITLTAFQMSQE